MSRERQLEGNVDDERDESHFSDTELDDDGNPVEDDENEEDDDADGVGDDAGDEDRGDNVLDEGEDETDIEALRAVAGDDVPTVPRARLNQVLAENQRMRDIIEQAAVNGGQRGEQRQVAAAPAAPTFDLKAKLKERADAILEGDTDKIVSLDEEIEEYRNTVVRQQGEQAGRTAATQAYQADRMDEIVNAAFSRYPFLNDQNADFSKDALGDVLMYKERYMKEGDAPSAALKKAVNRVCPYYAEELYGDDQKPRGKVNGKGKQQRQADDEADPNARDPKKIQRNARAGNRVPPNLSRAGTSNRAGARDMGDRGAKDIPRGEYRDMPEEERKRLRGDYV